MKEIDPKEFIDSTAFMDSLPDWRKKRLEGYLAGGLFVSHSGSDFPRSFFSDPKNVIEKIGDIVFARFGPNGHFLHSRESGGAESYRELVNIALTYCDKFLLMVSARSVHSPWVRAEVQFALANQRPIIEVYLDDTDIEELYSTLPVYLFHNHHSGRYSVSFNRDIEQGHAALGQLLDQLLAQLPYPREQIDREKQRELGRAMVAEWVRQIDGKDWDCVTMADEPVSGSPWHGRYAFDPEHPRPRHEPAIGLTQQLRLDWRPPSSADRIALALRVGK